MRSGSRPRALNVAGWLLVLFASALAGAQSVQPVIAEYTGKASGSFVVTNNSSTPAAVVFEPKSFDIDVAGDGHFRGLDASVHLELSANSVRLMPHESATIFYKTPATSTPEWFCIYATFTALHPGPGVNLRIMLPHTVYVYGKQALSKNNVRVDKLSFDPETHTIAGELTNIGENAGRVQRVAASAGRIENESAGFPLLPGQTRRFQVAWKEARAPKEVALEFSRFTLKLPVDTELEVP